VQPMEQGSLRFDPIVKNGLGFAHEDLSVSRGLVDERTRLDADAPAPRMATALPRKESQRSRRRFQDAYPNG